MKKSQVLLSVFSFILLIAVGLTSCKKDPVLLTLDAMVTGAIDLNGAVSPDNVPVNPSIVATFSTDLDETTVTSSSITMVQEYDNSPIELTISTSGKTATIQPVENLGNGILYKLTFSSTIKSLEEESLGSVTRTFTTLGTFMPKGAIAYFPFEDSPEDVIGDFDPSASGVVAISYTAGRNETAGKAAAFDGDASIIEVPNGDVLMNTANFSLTFWVKTNSSGHVNASGDPTGYFVMGLSAFYGFQFEITADHSSCKLAASYDLGDGTATGEDLWFNGEGQTRDNGGWQGWDFCKDLRNSGGVPGLLQDKWAHVVCVYNAEDKSGSLYINGEKMKSQNFNLWPDGDAKTGVVGLKYNGQEPETYPELAFGFIQSRAGSLWDGEAWGGYDFPTSNHFKGQLDDIAIYHKVLTETEIQLMYNSGN